MASTLRSLGHEPGSAAEKEWHNALAQAFDNVRGKVCKVCGLGGVGHGPESKSLGYERHTFDGIPATPAMLERAEELSREALRLRRVNEPSIYCGHFFASAACADNCVHVAGHCEHCELS